MKSWLDYVNIVLCGPFIVYTWSIGQLDVKRTLRQIMRHFLMNDAKHPQLCRSVMVC